MFISMRRLVLLFSSWARILSALNESLILLRRSVFVYSDRKSFIPCLRPI